VLFFFFLAWNAPPSSSFFLQWIILVSSHFLSVSPIPAVDKHLFNCSIPVHISFLKFIYSHVHTLFKPFLPPAPPLPPPCFQAEPVLPSSPILLEKT
jgi:hypothetical protein